MIGARNTELTAGKAKQAQRDLLMRITMLLKGKIVFAAAVARS